MLSVLLRSFPDENLLPLLKVMIVSEHLTELSIFANVVLCWMMCQCQTFKPSTKTSDTFIS